MSEAAILIVEDGRVFAGEAYGARGTALGEVAFSASMTGYQEVLTDPSYAGRIVTMTYPLIGNYGTHADGGEPPRPLVSGLVLYEAPPLHSSWRATESLESYLERTGVIAITGVDQRALALHIRSSGPLRGAIAPADANRDQLLEVIRSQPRADGLDSGKGEVRAEEYTVAPLGPRQFRVLAFDYDAASPSLGLLAERGCEVTVLPSGTPADAVLAREFDGLFVSSGPRDEQTVDQMLRTIRSVSDLDKPVFGVGLGHQLIARAFGGSTREVFFGHRGWNHPVRRLSDGAVEITAQNHDYAVAGDESSVTGAPELRTTHVNLDDQTVEGVEHVSRPVFSVQYHPQSGAGPHDSCYLFDRMIREMDARKAVGSGAA
ncbi:MAG: glutamine-hydrolyzing carbamoyl-phosphate synthase small subunit [Gemmatimonadota bacterium]|nr:glutamine-hydrolyzing carbamoyl-phosphate synthase small subunit [Gemmatimonadota bacterium]